MRDFGLWTDVEAASWARALPDPLQIASIAASLPSEPAFELLQYCTRRLKEKGIQPNGQFSYLHPSWEWLLEVATFHGMDSASLVAAVSPRAGHPQAASSKTTLYEDMALALEGLPPFAILMFCKVLWSNFVSNRRNRGDYEDARGSLMRLGLALDLATMVCTDVELISQIGAEFRSAIRTLYTTEHDRLAALEKLFQDGIFTVLQEIRFLDEELGYRLALDLAMEKNRGAWPAAFISRRDAEGFASTGGVFFIGSADPRLDYRIHILLETFHDDARKGIELCLRAIDAPLTVGSREDVRQTIPKRTAFLLISSAVSGGRPVQLFVEQYKSKLHQNFVQLLAILAQASFESFSGPVIRRLRGNPGNHNE